MSKWAKWLIVVGAMAIFVVAFLLVSKYSSLTLGPLPVFLVCAALYALGYLWTRPRGEDK